MPDQWFYLIDGHRRGPVSPSELRSLAGRGELGEGDFVWKEGMKDWTPAKNLRGLQFGVPGQTHSREPMLDQIEEPSLPTTPRAESSHKPGRMPALLSVISILASGTSLGIALSIASRSPFGTSINNYKFSTPQDTIQSVREIVANVDFRAGIELASMVMDFSNRGRDPEMMILLGGADNPVSKAIGGGDPSNFRLSVPRTVEVFNSSNTHNNGLLICFVNAEVRGVSYRSVFFFRRDKEGRVLPCGESFVFPFGTTPNDSDKAIQGAIEEFRRSGTISLK
jgi:hypothetical protein